MKKASGWRFFAVVSGVGLMGLVGCSSQVALTRSIIKEYGLGSEDIKKLQLYVSDGILLEQEVTKIDKDIDETHSLKKVEDRYIKQICFKSQTPCIALDVASDKMGVAFEPTDKLSFVYNPNHRHGDVFEYRPVRSAPADSIALPRQSGAGYYSWKRIGTDTYESTSFRAYVSRSAPYLLVDQASLRKFALEARVVPGMRQADIPPPQ